MIKIRFSTYTLQYPETTEYPILLSIRFFPFEYGFHSFHLLQIFFSQIFFLTSVFFQIV